MSKKHKGSKPKDLARAKAKASEVKAFTPEASAAKAEVSKAEVSKPEVTKGVISKPAAATGVLASVKSAGSSVLETLKHPGQLVNAVREGVTNAADAVDRTLEAVKTALENADEHVARAQDWTAEKAGRIETTLSTVRETVAAAGQLVDATQNQARVISESADRVLRESGESAEATAAGLKGKRRPAATIDAEVEEELAPETGTPLNADLEDHPSADEDSEPYRRIGAVRNGGSDSI